MSCRCELTGKGVLFGNNVSHSQRKTRRSFEPNIRVVRFTSHLLGAAYKLRVAANTLRSVEKTGGFDEYMLKAGFPCLSERAQILKRKIMRKYLEMSTSPVTGSEGV